MCSSGVTPYVRNQGDKGARAIGLVPQVVDIWQGLVGHKTSAGAIIGFPGDMSVCRWYSNSLGNFGKGVLQYHRWYLTHSDAPILERHAPRCQHVTERSTNH